MARGNGSLSTERRRRATSGTYEDNLRGWRDKEGRRHIQSADELSSDDDEGVSMWFPHDGSDSEQGGHPDVREGGPAHVDGATAASAETVAAVYTGLEAWHRALEGAFASSPAESPVMPMRFGGNESVDNAAWLGDKYLGCAVAKVPEAMGVKGKDNLTWRHSALVCNANLAKRMDGVLPEHIRKLLPSPGFCARPSLMTALCGTVV